MNNGVYIRLHFHFLLTLDNINTIKSHADNSKLEFERVFFLLKILINFINYSIIMENNH